mmetsp:Transcript_13157/g.43161  ORF Transcript_13157/g.43161 Transcript_13157/m.43161 type:complete len:280 (-) Transcript_13157:348-1187(-)|eukprot:scaffold1567_cov106-Isochrysis_galbana.AAC.6
MQLQQNGWSHPCTSATSSAWMLQWQMAHIMPSSSSGSIVHSAARSPSSSSLGSSASRTASSASGRSAADETHPSQHPRIASPPLAPACAVLDALVSSAELVPKRAARPDGPSGVVNEGQAAGRICGVVGAEPPTKRHAPVGECAAEPNKGDPPTQPAPYASPACDALASGIGEGTARAPGTVSLAEAHWAAATTGRAREPSPPASSEVPEFSLVRDDRASGTVAMGELPLLACVSGGPSAASGKRNIIERESLARAPNCGRGLGASPDPAAGCESNTQG